MRLLTCNRTDTDSRRSEEGMFKAELQFPDDFPNNPPKMIFTSEMWHPNSKFIDA